MPLIASDVFALTIAVAIPWLAMDLGSTAWGISVPALLSLLALGLVVVRAGMGLYPGFGIHGAVELERSATSSVLIFGSFILSDFLTGLGWAYRGLLLTAAVLNAVLAPLLRALTRHMLGRFTWWRQPLLILGAGPGARRVENYFDSNPSLGFTPIALHGREGDADHSLAFERLMREPEAVVRLAKEYGSRTAAIPMSEDPQPREAVLIEQCVNVFPRVLIIAEPTGLPGFWTNSADLGSAVGLRICTNLLNPVAVKLKRILDFTLTVPIVLMSLPAFAFVALAVRVTSPGPILYRSTRIGKDREPITVFKFRTMYTDADEVLERALASDERMREEWELTQKLVDDPRLTPVGYWLRRTSLDELPQLWNVIRGDMSLVGPRPVIPVEIGRRKGIDASLYLSMPPGLTGLWQVSGRNETTYAERIRLDSHYVRTWSPWLDLHILGRTVRAVLTGEGAY